MHLTVKLKRAIFFIPFVIFGSGSGEWNEAAEFKWEWG